MSKSSLYQRKDIPRYRRPGSRALLFDQDELEVWLRAGRIEPVPAVIDSSDAPLIRNIIQSDEPFGLRTASMIDPLDIQQTAVYHRNSRYR